jgi:hypothetical protein
VFLLSMPFCVQNGWQWSLVLTHMNCKHLAIAHSPVGTRCFTPS